MKRAEQQEKLPSLKAECIHEVCRHIKRRSLTYSANSRYARLVEMLLIQGGKSQSMDRPWAEVEDNDRELVIRVCEEDQALSLIRPSHARLEARIFRRAYRIEPIRPADSRSGNKDAIVDQIRRLQPFTRHKDEVEGMMRKGGFGATTAFIENPFLENAATVVVDDAPDYLGCQVVAFRIHWNDGSDAILDAFEKWLQRQPWASKRRAGPKENFPKVQRWLRIVELLDAGKSDSQVQRIVKADGKTVATARKNLTAWLKRWLGVKHRSKQN